MNNQDEGTIYNLWVKAWNEDISVLDDITDPDCKVHQQRTDGKTADKIRGPQALKRIIDDGCLFFDDVLMEVEVGPIVNPPYISARWKFSGTYKGGMPDAKAEASEKMSFNGTDIFRLKYGRITDYWVTSDGIHLMKQLGMF